MSDWKEITLSEIIEIEMGQSPKGEFCNTNGEGIPLLNGPTEFGVKSPFPVQFTIRANKVSKENDILFCVRGSTTGRMNWADQEYAIGRGIAAIRHKLGIKYNGFARAIMDHKLPELLSQATGSTFPNISKSQIENVKVKVPQQREQLAISHFLNTVDAKLNLLYLQNLTLEQLSQTLFKRWFVDFEFPNEENQPYKSSGGKMVASELGEIPEGWEVRSLSEIANFLNGLACQKFPPENDNESLPVLKIKELGNGISANSDRATSKMDEKYVVNKGDVIFSWSGTLMLKVWAGEKAILNQHLFKVTSKEFPDCFFYNWTRIHLEKFIGIAKSKATTMGHINRSHLDEAFCLIPNPNQLERQDQILEPLWRNQINNSKEIETLKNLRDALLPKLMSGEVRVKI